MHDNTNINTFVPLYEYDEKVDKFINTLIDHMDEWKNVYIDECEICLTYNNRRFSLWIENKFYGYLNRIIEFECRNGNTVLLNECKKKSPSKETIQRFYNEVELKFRKKKEYSNDDWLNI